MDAPPPEPPPTPDPAPAPAEAAPPAQPAPATAQPAPATHEPAAAKPGRPAAKDGPPASTTPTVKRGRRWPALLIVGLLVFAVAYVGFFFRYQPLTATDGTAWADPTYATKVGDFTSPAGEDFTQYNVHYADGDHFRFMFTLTNTGGLPVTVNDVRMYPACADCHYLLQDKFTAMLPHGANENDPTHARPFQPFKLGGGDYRNIVITAKFVDCKAFSDGDVQTYSNVWVQLRSGMIPHDAVLPLGYNLSVVRKGACPS